MKQTKPKCSIVSCSSDAVFIETDKSYTCGRHHMIKHYPDMVEQFYGDDTPKKKKPKKSNDLIFM